MHLEIVQVELKIKFLVIVFFYSMLLLFEKLHNIKLLTCQGADFLLVDTLNDQMRCEIHLLAKKKSTPSIQSTNLPVVLGDPP